MRFNILSLALASLLISSQAFAQSQWIASGPREAVTDIESKDGRVYLLTERGLYVSSDDKNWQKLRTIPSGQFFVSMVALNSGDLLMFSYQWYLRSTDQGTSWTRVTEPNLSIRKCIADSAGRLYLGDGGAVETSDDTGKTWVASSEGTSQNFYDIGVITLAPDGTIYAGNQGITGGMAYRSKDRGASWQLLHSEFMTDVAAIEVYEGMIWIAYRDRILLSADDGNTWSTMSTPGHVRSLFVTGENEALAGTSTGLFSTEDLGSSWQGPAAGIHGNSIQQIKVSPRNTLLVGTDSGLFMRAPAASVTNAKMENICIAPNPAHGAAKVSEANGTTIMDAAIYDQLGRRMVTFPWASGSRESVADISGLARGVYLVIVRSRDGNQIARLQVE